ncbi:hypothetical protein PG985_003935 [Apiospora marii]|uniref:Rhodopsin domain-containing protein n=1 Tax=Apiospora marii TaxID=335849 RepID=A0ABR1SGN9_9PEZI
MDPTMDSTNTSVIPPPAGQESNFINPPNQLPAVYVTSALVLALPLIGVSARLFVSLFVVPGHRIEDFLSYFAFASFVSYVAVILHLAGMNLTRHMYDITLAEIPDILYWTNIVYCMYSVPTAAAKLSVLFQLKSIFTVGTRNAVFWVIVVSIVINVIFYAGLFFSYVFQCWPREKIWLGDMVDGRCTDAGQVNLSSGILNIISDVEALAIPTWAIWHLSMPVKRKLAALSIFGVSLLAIGIGIGGLVIRIRVLSDIDQTWWLTQLALIATTEISIVIFVGCMPSFSRLYRRFCGTGSGTENKPPAKAGIVTFGSSEKPSRSGKSGKLSGKLSSTLAKYMGPRGTGVTTLGTSYEDEDRFELREHVASTATAGVATPVTYSQNDDVERGGDQPAVANNLHGGAPQHNNSSNNNIWKTSQVGQTYDRRPEDN